ncbi:MAG: hypothetical protein CMP96_01035 [Gammaproteobacteria bacterium]|nr:hypothetical protein [Gammaproteobacteria bacterium]
MTTTLTLDLQMNRFGFWSAVIAIVTGMISFFLPLDAPGGYTAEHADRVAWLTANRDLFILGWLNQIAAMFSLSGVFFAIAWHIAVKNPLRAALAAMVVLLSVVAFIIPKFMAIWTIPQLADVITNNAVGAELADPLLTLLNVSVPFSLYTSFDYLGFWLYGVFSLLVAGPLYGDKTSAKIAAITLGMFGVIYHGLLASLLLGSIAPPDIESSFLVAAGLLLVAVVVMSFNFWSAAKTE